MASLFDDDPKISGQDGVYELEATSLESISEAANVRTAADSMLELLNGVAKVHAPSHRPVHLTGTFRRGDAFHAATITGTARVVMVAPAGRVVIQSPDGAVIVESPSPASIGSAWFEVAESNPNVAQALRLLQTQGEVDWPELYKLVEIITHDVDGDQVLVANGWATASELDAFRAAANWPDPSRPNARHARRKGSRPKRAMTIDRARPFVKGPLRSWVEWRTQHP